MTAVEANLRAESAGLRMRIDGKGAVLTCRFDGDGASLFGALRRSRSFLPALRALVPVLLRIGVRVDVMAGNVRIGRAGSGVKQNAAARLLRLPSTHLGI